MTPDQELVKAVRVLLRHPVVKAELAAIVAEVGAGAPAAEGYVTTRDAGAFLGVRPETVKEWAKSGLLEAVRPVGTKSWRFRLSGLKAFVERRGSQPARIIDIERERQERADKITDSLLGGRKR